MADERDREVVLSESELKTLPMGYLMIHREMGWKALRSGKPEVALRSFHAAAAAHPEDMRTLVGRAQTRERLMMVDNALRDANKILQLNDADKDGILLEAKCEVARGNFEDSLVMFTRGINKRGERGDFVQGKEAAHATLEDCIGRYAGDTALAKLAPAIHGMVKEHERIKAARNYRKVGYHRMKSNCLEELSEKPSFSGTSEQWRRHEKLQQLREKELCKIYLGQLAYDYEWCKSLSDDKSDPKLQEMAKNALQEMDSQLKLVKARKPGYYLQNKPYFPIVMRQKTRVQDIKSHLETVEVCRLFKNLKTFHAKQETKNCFYEAYKIKMMLEKFPKQRHSLILGHLEDLCYIISLVYKNDLKLCEELSPNENRQRIDHFLGFQSLYNEVWVDPAVQKSTFPFFNTTQWQKTFKEFAGMAEKDFEKCWHHYEIARTYLIKKKWEHLVVETNKVVTFSRQCGNLIWRLNAYFLAVIGQCHLKNRIEALDDLETCIQTALEMGDETVLQFLNTAKEVLQNKRKDAFYAGIDKIIKKREKSIIHVQRDVQSKERAHDLLSRIRFLPANRRLALVPGLKLQDDKIKSQNKSIIRGGSGGRLGLHPITNQSYLEFCNLE